MIKPNTIRVSVEESEGNEIMADLLGFTGVDGQVVAVMMDREGGLFQRPIGCVHITFVVEGDN